MVRYRGDNPLGGTQGWGNRGSLIHICPFILRFPLGEKDAIGVLGVKRDQRVLGGWLSSVIGISLLTSPAVFLDCDLVSFEVHCFMYMRDLWGQTIKSCL